MPEQSHNSASIAKPGLADDAIRIFRAGVHFNRDDAVRDAAWRLFRWRVFYR